MSTIRGQPQDQRYQLWLCATETTIGLYKTEAVRADSPFRRGPLNRLADVEMLTADWVHWYNTSRLIHRLDRTPPVEFEARYYTQQRATKTEAHQ